jgi:ankyrin repeat protein
MMNVRAVMLAGLFGLPLVSGLAPAAQTGNLSLVDAARSNSWRRAPTRIRIFYRAKRPLMEAAHRGNLATLRALLAGGANPNAQEVNGGQSALMLATSERHPGVTEELVRHGADINARSKAVSPR